MRPKGSGEAEAVWDLERLPEKTDPHAFLLLADIQTRIILRQPPDQVGVAADLFALTERERDWIGQLARGRALWRLQSRGAVVQTVLTEAEKRRKGRR